MDYKDMNAIGIVRLMLTDGVITEEQAAKYFPELKENEDEKIRKYLIDVVNYYCKGREHDGCIAWLEKQGNLVNYYEDKLDRCACEYFNKGYKNALEKQGEQKLAEETRLWTIQDAKDGDVLVASDGSIFLFKGMTDCACKHYVALTTDGIIKFNEGLEHYWETSTAVHLATKEQRDTLFAKMKEAGYEWDAEKLELRKFEQKHADSPKGEDYGIDGLYNAIRILEKTLGKVDGYQTDDGILEHECAITAVKRLYEQKPWSEEDEKQARQIERIAHNGCSQKAQKRIAEWLKSLKNRVQPQQKQEWSEEEKKMLDCTIRAVGLCKQYAINHQVNGYSKLPDVPKVYEELQDWLKALKERYAVFDTQSHSYHNNLSSLKQQLKKLREE